GFGLFLLNLEVGQPGVRTEASTQDRIGKRRVFGMSDIVFNQDCLGAFSQQHDIAREAGSCITGRYKYQMQGLVQNRSRRNIYIRTISRQRQVKRSGTASFVGVSKGRFKGGLA